MRCECGVSGLRVLAFGAASAGFRGCECWLSGLRVRCFGTARIYVSGCAYIRADLYACTRRRQLMLDLLVIQGFIHGRCVDTY